MLRPWLLFPILIVLALMAVEAWVVGPAAMHAWSPRTLAPVLLLIFFWGNASGRMATFAACFLGLLYASQLLNYGFYNNSLQPELMPAIFNESEDIFLALSSEPLINAVYVLIGVLLAAALIVTQRHGRQWGATPVWIVLLALSAHALSVSDIRKFKPRQDLTLMENTLRAYQGFYFHSMPAYFTKDNVRYVHVDEHIAPVQERSPRLVVFIIGESLSAGRMSLFGYDKDTTPRLRALHESGSGQFREGWSSATSTVSAVTGLLLTLNDPRDIKGLRAQNGNLFRLARQAGYTTHYWSAQRANVVDRVDLHDVADFRTTDNDAGIRAHAELEFLRLLKALPQDRSHFVVLHLRVGHAPYDYSQRLYPGPEVSDPNSLEAYEQAVQAIDRLVSDTLAQIRQDFPDYDVYFTSDHGELFGEDGLIGHAMLSYRVAKVPMVFWTSRDRHPELFTLARTPSHYDLARSVARSLGYEVRRGGEETGYINGIGFAGSSGLLQYDRRQK